MITDELAGTGYHVEFIAYKTKVVQFEGTRYYILKNNEHVETTEEIWEGFNGQT